MWSAPTGLYIYNMPKEHLHDSEWNLIMMVNDQSETANGNPEHIVLPLNWEWIDINGEYR